MKLFFITLICTCSLFAATDIDEQTEHVTLANVHLTLINDMEEQLALKEQDIINAHTKLLQTLSSFADEIQALRAENILLKLQMQELKKEYRK